MYMYMYRYMYMYMYMYMCMYMYMYIYPDGRAGPSLWGSRKTNAMCNVNTQNGMGPGGSSPDRRVKNGWFSAKNGLPSGYVKIAIENGHL